jgi:hypothetical protein
LTGTLANKRKTEKAALEWYKLTNLTTPEAVGVILISSGILGNGENVNSTSVVVINGLPKRPILRTSFPVTSLSFFLQRIRVVQN